MSFQRRQALFRAPIPRLDRAVVTGAGQERRGDPAHGPYKIGVPAQRADAAAGGDLPESDGLVRASGRDLVVSPAAKGRNAAVPRGDGRRAPPGPQVKDLHLARLAAGGHGEAVDHAQGVDPAAVSGERGGARARHQVPDPQGAVVAACYGRGGAGPDGLPYGVAVSCEGGGLLERALLDPKGRDGHEVKFR